MLSTPPSINPLKSALHSGSPSYDWLIDGRIILDFDEIAEASHVTVQEVDESDSEIDLTKALEALEDYGQATIDELKESNLRSVEEPRLVNVSSMLTPKEEEEYFKLLCKYKDVFVWSCKEMSGLDPKVTVHDLSIKNGFSPKKQLQQHF